MDWQSDVIAFGCSELGMRLEDVYDMSWAEFCIKSFGYRRMMENELKQTRKIAYYALRGPHVNPKSIPNKESLWWRIGDEIAIRGATEDQRQSFKDEYKQYLQEREAAIAKRAKEN